jgi:glycosyltransferase involved in cell wall biosynthesis
VLAHSLGVPAVAADLVANREVGAPAWLFRPGDPASLGRALERAVAERESAAELGARAQAAVRCQTWHDAARATMMAIESGLDGDRARRLSGSGSRSRPR